jgi:uncharacterized membrane protein YgcG
MAKKLKFEFKKAIVERGEKIGFYAAAGLLVVFLALGGYVASKAASPATIVRDMDAKVNTVQQKTISGSSETAPLDPVIYYGAIMAKIGFTEHVTPNDFFNTATDEHMKRMNPKILSITDAQVQFIRGSMVALDIIEDPVEGSMIAVLGTKATTRNSAGMINRIIKGNKGRPQPPPGPPPPAAPPPPSGFPGGKGGGASRGGPPGGGAGFGAGGQMQTARTGETEVQYMKLDAKGLETAKIADTIIPKRMVVVTGSIPYKKQLELYAGALQAPSITQLAANDLPLYRGFNVQRQVWSVDGKDMVADWADLDMKETLGPLFARITEFEPDVYTKDAALAMYFDRLIPDQSTELVVPRPKLKRGEYEPLDLPPVDAALKALKDLGGNVGQLKNNMQRRLDSTNPFNPSGLDPGAPGQGGFPGGGFPGGGGAPGGGASGAMGDEQPAGKRPPGGRGNPPGMPAAGNPQVPEDCWIMRFIDVTIEPGYVYRYRVQLKAANPNFKKNVKELAMPKFADEEELISGWFELPNPVSVPHDEFIYAAAKDEQNRRVTEKNKQVEGDDVTYLQVHRWAEYARPIGLPRPEPIGDWLVADIKAHRGQTVGESTKVKLPLWSMVAGSFLFRDPPRTNTGSIFGGGRPRADGMWPVDFTPLPPMLLVDFDGGSGTFVANRKQINDQAAVDVLLLTDDGKLIVRRSQADLANVERQKREDTWKKWIAQVQDETNKFRNGSNVNAPGGPGAPGSPSAPGSPGGGGNPGG